MTNRELIRAAAERRPAGAVPYYIGLTGEGYKAYGERLMHDYPDEKVQDDLAHGRINFNEAVSLSIGNNLLYLYAPWWDWYNVPVPDLEEEDTPEKLPDTVGTGSYPAFFEHCRYICGNYDVYPLVAVWGSHWEKAYFSRGIENFLYDLAAEPGLAQEKLDFIIRKNLVMLENILPAGEFDGVLLGSDWGSQKCMLISPAMWRRMIRQGEEKEYELLRRYGKHVWIHSCGCITDIMPDLCDMGVNVLNPVQPECMDIAALQRDYGSRISFFGGISTQRTLPYGTPADVIRETEETVALMRTHGGYITAPAQEIQTDVPYENLRALIDTARAFR